MLAQNQLFRANALGNFGDILKAISRDGAMIRWLDLQTNRKGAPNENYARELMELFTLGVGNYTEDDVDEVARAFTGWSATPDGQFVFRQTQHDFGTQDDPRPDRQLRRRRRQSTMLAANPATAALHLQQAVPLLRLPEPRARAWSIGWRASTRRAAARSRRVVEAILRSPEFSSEQAYRGLDQEPDRADRRGRCGRSAPRRCRPRRSRRCACWARSCSIRRTWPAGSAIAAGSTRRRCSGDSTSLGTLAMQLGGPVAGGQPVATLLGGAQRLGEPRSSACWIC